MSHQKFFIIITIMLFGVVSWGKADPINYGLKAEERTGREFDEFWVNDTGDSFIYRHHPYYDERDSKLWNVNGTFVNIDRVSGKYFHPSLYSFFSFSGFKGDGNNFGNLIDTKSYEVLWKYKFPKNSHSEEVRVLHNVVVIYEGVSTKGFDLKTGAVLWEIEPIEGFDSVIHSNDRYLYVNSWDSEGGFKMFDPQNGKKLFSRTKVRQWWERGKYLFVIDRKDLGHLLKYEISNFNNKTSYPIDPRIRDPYKGSSATDSVVRGISPDGKYVILSGGIVVETEGWTKAAELPNFSDDLFEPVAFSANGNFLLSSYKGGSDSMVVYDMKTFKIFGISEVLDNKGYLAPIALSNDGNNFVAMLTTSGARYHLFFEPRKSPSEVECKFKSTQQMAELLNTHVKRFNASQTGICSLYSRYRNGHSETRSASSYPIYAKFGFDMTEPGPIVSLSGKLSYKCDDDVVITDAGGVKAICNEQNEITSVSATIDWSRCSSNPIQENNLFFDTKTKKRDVYLVKQTKTTWTDGGYSIDTVTCTSR